MATAARLTCRASQFFKAEAQIHGLPSWVQGKFVAWHSLIEAHHQPQGRSDVQGCRDIASLNPACNAADSLTSLPRSKPGWQSCQSHSPPSCKGTRMVCFIESNFAWRAAVIVSVPGACPSNAFMILATLCLRHRTDSRRAAACGTPRAHQHPFVAACMGGEALPKCAETTLE